MKNLYVILSAILIATNIFTLTQLNRSNSYIAHITQELEKKDKIIASHDKEIDEIYSELTDAYSQNVYLETQVAHWRESYFDNLPDEPLQYYDVSEYTSLIGLKEAEPEDLEDVERLRREYYLNRD